METFALSRLHHSSPQSSTVFWATCRDVLMGETIRWKYKRTTPGRADVRAAHPYLQEGD
jgi:hypothetical protein